MFTFGSLWIAVLSRDKNGRALSAPPRPAAAPHAAFGMFAIGFVLMLFGCPHVRAEIEQFSASDAAGFSGKDKPTFGAYAIADFLDGEVLRKIARETERQNLMQPGVGGLRSAGNSALAPAGAPRARAWSMAFSGTDVFREFDRAMFTAYLPMRGARTVQRIAEKVFDSPALGSLVSNARALSLMARGRINAEFTYSTQFSKRSSLDASAIYRLNANRPTGKSDLVLGLYYKATF